MDQLKRFFVVKDVAAITRLSKSEVYGLIGKQILPSIRLPGCNRILVDPDDLQRYLDSGRTQTPLVHS